MNVFAAVYALHVANSSTRSLTLCPRSLDTAVATCGLMYRHWLHSLTSIRSSHADSHILSVFLLLLFDLLMGMHKKAWNAE